MKQSWDIKTCSEAANQCVTLREFRKNFASAYNAARSHGWLEVVAVNLVKSCRENGYWDKERVFQAAKDAGTIAKFRKISGAYAAAIRKGWIDEVRGTLEIKKRHNGFYTLDVCKKIAAKYKTRVEFCRSDIGAYQASLKHGWSDEVCAHMGRAIRRTDADVFYMIKEKDEMLDGHVLVKFGISSQRRGDARLSESFRFFKDPVVFIKIKRKDAKSLEKKLICRFTKLPETHEDGSGKSELRLLKAHEIEQVLSIVNENVK